MYAFYLSCSRDIPAFSNMPFGEQAPCYCCLTARGQATWTDELDKYAQTCRDWARKSGGPGNTVYSVASTFAGFCKKFSNACQPNSTPLANDASSTSAAASAVTSNSRGTTASTIARPTTTTAGAAAVRVGAAAAAAALVPVLAFLLAAM